MRDLVLRNSLFPDFDRVFNDNWSDLFLGRKDYTDRFFKDTGDSLVASIDVPGLSEKDINIELKDRTLTVVGKTEERYIHRKFLIPFEPTSEITANLGKGVLEILIPKPEVALPKQISITVKE